MNKISNSVITNISENNNEYRNILNELKRELEEKASSIVGDIVTISNYVVDFSKTVASSKEELADQIAKAVESYAIKDLRNVEEVNEQFFEKINDKIENANLTNDEDVNSFIKNLDGLLNDKYLEIIKIKRSSFYDQGKTNSKVEEIIKNYVNYIKDNYNYENNKIVELLDNYKNNSYLIIDSYLERISNLYLNNFKNGILDALSSVKESAKEEVANNALNNEVNSYESALPELNNLPDLDIPEIPLEEENNTLELASNDENINVSVEPVIEPSILDIPEIPSINVEEPKVEVQKEVKKEKTIEEVEEKKEEKTSTEPEKKKYDVEEILKIAKSPVLSMEKTEPKKEDNYINLEPIEKEEEVILADTDLNERELVEELINRLKLRLKAIDERQIKYDIDKKQVEEDEAFVNDLIISSNSKKDELNKLEEQLNEKERELNKKQTELEKKINDVMPFANAVLNNK